MSLSLDIHKAFDSLSWEYLLAKLQKWGFGPEFCTWIIRTYDTPRARIRYAGFQSNFFPIQEADAKVALCPLSFSPSL